MDKKLAKLIISTTIFIFILSYVISESGYYEYTMKQRTVITNEKIKEFEEDIKNNEDIDLLEYLEKETIDYSNAFTTFVYNLSENSSELTKEAVKYLFKKLGSLLEE